MHTYCFFSIFEIEGFQLEDLVVEVKNLAFDLLFCLVELFLGKHYLIIELSGSDRHLYE
jgi:hypothetical protein